MLKNCRKAGASSGSNLKHAHLLNQRVILQAIRLYGPVCRVELAHATGLTPQTVFNITAGLKRSGLIQELGQETGRRGPPAKAFGMNADGAFSIGVQLGNEQVTAVLLDLAGNVRGRAGHMGSHLTPEDTLKEALRAVKTLQRKVNGKRVCGVGLALPGPMDLQSDGICHAPNLPGLEKINFQDALGTKTGLRVLVDNDSTAAAVGEHWCGVARDFDIFCYLYIGAGVRAGMVSAGQPFRGFRARAGEVGHMVVDRSAGAQPCVCGKRGCLDTCLSLDALGTHLRNAGVQGTEPSQLVALLEGRNEIFLKWLGTAASRLSDVIETLQLVLDPEAFVLGGCWPEPLLAHLSERCQYNLKTRIRPRGFPDLKILPASLEGGAAWGAAVLPIAEFITPNYEGITEGKSLTLLQN